MKNILYVLKKIVLSYFVLYCYNLIAVNFNFVIPINIVTIIFLSSFGLPSLIALLLFKILVL